MSIWIKSSSLLRKCSTTLNVFQWWNQICLYYMYMFIRMLFEQVNIKKSLNVQQWSLDYLCYGASIVNQVRELAWGETQGTWFKESLSGLCQCLHCSCGPLTVRASLNFATKVLLLPQPRPDSTDRHHLKSCY